jgi:hypothetical protein
LGNGIKIAEAARTGGTKGLVWATPSEVEDGFPQGDKNTLRRSNLGVGEGKPVPANQEELLPIGAGSPEGETKILKKTTVKDPGNIGCPASPMMSGAASMDPLMDHLIQCDITKAGNLVGRPSRKLRAAVLLSRRHQALD